MTSQQTTLAGRAVIDGVGVHTGAPVRLTLQPAAANAGLTFIRVLENGDEASIPAHHSLVGGTELQTVLVGRGGESVATTEHLLAALRGLGVDNARIVVEGPEAPICDGSAAAFVAAIDEVGLKTLPVARRVTRVLKPVRVDLGRGFAELAPATAGFHLDVTIDFASEPIGRQRIRLDLGARTFRAELSRARTFGFIEDVRRLGAAGLALGASMDNTVVLGSGRVLNAGGLRFADEFVRHKALDAVGDLALSGPPLIGRFRSYRSGHRLNGAVLGALLADPTAYAIVEADAPRRAPGWLEPRPAGLVPALGSGFD